MTTEVTGRLDLVGVGGGNGSLGGGSSHQGTPGLPTLSKRQLGRRGGLSRPIRRYTYQGSRTKLMSLILDILTKPTNALWRLWI